MNKICTHHSLVLIFLLATAHKPFSQTLEGNLLLVPSTHRPRTVTQLFADL